MPVSRPIRVAAVAALLATALAAPATTHAADRACTLSASIKAANHSPHADKHFYVTVTTKPSTTTVHAKYQFLFNGNVVSTQYVQNDKNFHFRGRFRDGLLFPPHAIGIALTVRVVLTSVCGRKTVDWKIKTVK
ncbi:MAG TPA: hypothetical protein VHB30_10255 [Solirubrobacteraceae bacterium]|jgi:hypothetical protein|nr:hypothetical protein [Solirubrobacteraceae bacterium]